MTEPPFKPALNAAVRYKRVVMKISGEALGNREKGESIDAETLESVCGDIREVYHLGVEVGLVVGGGNIFRGLSGAKNRKVDRATGDHMGMLATAINGLALMDCLEQMGVPVRVQSALPIQRVCESFILRRAIRHMEKGRVVIFVAGTGNPYFSTDTTAALRASEIRADVILKATKVDGVYNADPFKDPAAARYENLTFGQALREDLKVMDGTAFALCRENSIPIMVFRMTDPGALRKAVCGEPIGTLVC
mgnify:CR=1 FL=1